MKRLAHVCGSRRSAAGRIYSRIKTWSTRRLTDGEATETLHLAFSSHDVQIIGHNLRSLFLALQDFAVKWIRPMPERYRAFEASDDGVVVEVRSKKRVSSQKSLVQSYARCYCVHCEGAGLSALPIADPRRRERLYWLWSGNCARAWSAGAFFRRIGFCPVSQSFCSRVFLRAYEIANGHSILEIAKGRGRTVRTPRNYRRHSNPLRDRQA